MRKNMFAANWKMNQSIKGMSDYFKEFWSILEESNHQRQNTEIVFAIPSTLIHQASELLKNKPAIVAAQNCHQEDSGAFTGELSVHHLMEVGADAVVIGHSERRQFFGETDAAVSAKVIKCQQVGLLPIVCVGESLSQRERGETVQTICRQVESVISGLPELGSLVIAYEPVWAIGTGLAATPIQAQEVHLMIRDLVEKKFGSQVAESLRVLYGGSMNPANCTELMGQTAIDGGLVGGASLKPEQFAEMVLQKGEQGSGPQEQE